MKRGRSKKPREGFGTIGKQVDESVRVLLEHGTHGTKLILEDGDDGMSLVLSPHCIGELIDALHKANHRWLSRHHQPLAVPAEPGHATETT